MKKILFNAALVVSTSCSIYAQNVTIPDANFKAFLIGDASINTNNDTEIQVSEAQAFTGTLNCSNLNISDLTGIEAFTGMTNLICNNNNLTTLDLSANTNLIFVYCYENELTSLNINNCTNLTDLYCDYNQLTSIDISSNTSLNELNASNNLLSSIDCSNNANLGYLNLNNNQLTLLDLSNNVNISGLYCSNNQLTSLSLSHITELFEFACSGNQITTIDFGTHNFLIGVYCGYNQITSLDLSNCPTLTALDCQNNELVALNLANGNNTDMNFISAIGNPNLICIQVDDAAYSTNNWTTTAYLFDASASFSEDCGTASLNELEKLEMEIYPNPATSSITVELTSLETVRILDVNGALVFQSKANSIHLIDVSEFNSGIYFILSESGVSRRFVKE